MYDSDEDGEIVPDRVKDYYCFDQNKELIPFATLPLQWSDDEIMDDVQTQVFLCGTGDDGFQEIRKRVIAWKFDLSHAQPEISLLLSKDKTWIQLQEPEKSYQILNNSLLISIHYIHFLKKYPEASEETLWDYLQKTFSSEEFEPSKEDLVAHMPLIMEAATQNEDLAKSKCLISFMEDRVKRTETPHECPLSFGGDCLALESSKTPHEEDMDAEIISFMEDSLERTETPHEYLLSFGGYSLESSKIPHEEDMDYIDYYMEELDNEDESFDEAEPFADSVCAICDNGGKILSCEGGCMRSFHATEADGIDCSCESLHFTIDAQVEAIPTFWCENCKFKKHQCFACGKLGSSDRSSSAEVFQCISATCGHFYHPKCVAELLHPDNEVQAIDLRVRINRGETFTCPAHTCVVCHQIEDTKVHELQFALCRRCPQAYHRKCLPREISFEGSSDAPTRAWDGLLPNRVLIYCTKHVILPELATPARDHLTFRNDGGRKIKLKFSKTTLFTSITGKPTMKMPTAAETVCETVKTGHFNMLDKEKHVNAARSCLKQNQSSDDNNGNSTVKRKRVSFNMSRPDTQKTRKVSFAGPNNQRNNEQPSSIEMENRIRNLIRESNASFDVEGFLRKHNATSTSSLATMMAKKITSCNVERSVGAMRAALQKLEAGGTIEEAKAICKPSIIYQIVDWQTKLRVYMAPFLNGPRYSSFGRHFTKLKKLKEIADRLKWYIQTGDTIVDFCCGSNDFSCLMKEKLDEIEKPCNFKNYDIFPPQNNFCFEKRDWHTVDVKELPEGSKLIMGLNPPFGVKASLANKFINKALQFKPKLLILIVPNQTKSLAIGPEPYDLIWKDTNLLYGKAFYIPGSTDKRNQKMEDWNVKPPPVYLWSRRDWSSRHWALAEEYGHLGASENIAGKAAAVACDLKGKGVPQDNIDPPEPTNLNEEADAAKHTDTEDSNINMATTSPTDTESSLGGGKSDAIDPSGGPPPPNYPKVPDHSLWNQHQPVVPSTSAAPSYYPFEKPSFTYLQPSYYYPSAMFTYLPPPPPHQYSYRYPLYEDLPPPLPPPFPPSPPPPPPPPGF